MGKLFMPDGMFVSKRAFNRLRTETSKTAQAPEVKAEEAIFLRNAFLFRAATDRILADERLCYIPVPFYNNLAYTGTSGLSGATLGVYVSWWRQFEAALTDDNRLLYCFAGSPLSGANGCRAVAVDGRTSRYVVSGRFTPVWGSFITVNRTFSPALKQAHTDDSLATAERLLRSDPAVLSAYADSLRTLGLAEPMIAAALTDPSI